jgi:hypothetical protein
MKYNTGEWYPFDKKRVPVNKKSVVQVLTRYGGTSEEMIASNVYWGSTSEVIAFKIIKEHKEPREFWLVRNADSVRYNVINQKPNFGWKEIIHVKEVKDE